MDMSPTDRYQEIDSSVQRMIDKFDARQDRGKTWVDRDLKEQIQDVFQQFEQAHSLGGDQTGYETTKANLSNLIAKFHAIDQNQPDLSSTMRHCISYAKNCGIFPGTAHHAETKAFISQWDSRLATMQSSHVALTTEEQFLQTKDIGTAVRYCLNQAKTTGTLTIDSKVPPFCNIPREKHYMIRESLSQAVDSQTPEELQGIKKICIEHVDLGVFPTRINKFQNLEELTFKGCYIATDSNEKNSRALPYNILSGCKACTHLKRLSLQGCKFDIEQPDQRTEFINMRDADRRALQSLGVAVRGDQYKSTISYSANTVLVGLRGHPSLEEIDLSYSDLATKCHAQYFDELVLSTPTLQKITITGASTVPESLGGTTKGVPVQFTKVPGAGLCYQRS